MHYETICSWWRKHDWPEVPLSHLPPTGIVVTAEGKPVCAGFIYLTSSAFCLFEWIVADPDAEKSTRSACLDKLIESAKDLSKRMGAEHIFMSIKGVGLQWRLEKHGFEVTDRKMTNLVGKV